MSRLEQIEQQRIYTLIDRIARDLGVKRSQVTNAGPSLDPQGWTIICLDCRQRRGETPEPHTWVAGVDLLHKYNSVNGTTGGVYAVLVGQCQECGQVYFSQATVREAW